MLDGAPTDGGISFFEPQDIVPNTDPYNPRLATDAALTAFAQLASLKLNCERAFISLIDDTKQYIIAEATRTLSLESANTYDEDNDKLSFGQTVLDFKTGVCPGTIACFTSLNTSLELSTAYIKANRDHYVMNDMSALENYKNRSYVADWPYMKYYAEVPIHSPAGHTIGTLCVVDNKARHGLDLKGLSVLKEISNAVMDHLELCVSKIQRNRAERMIQALGQFVEGGDSIRKVWEQEETSRLPEPSARHLTIEQRADKEFGSVTRNSILTQDLGQDFRQLDLQDPLASPDLNSDGTSAISSSINGAFVSATQSILRLSSSAGESNSTETTIPLQSENVHTNPGLGLDSSDESQNSELDPLLDSESLETILSRAANLIREAIDLDAVMFLDPRLRSGQLASQSASSNSPTTPRNTRSNRKDAGVTLTRIISSSNKSQQPCDAIAVPETMLQTLINQFVNGGLLSFDKAGILRAIPFDSQLDDPKSGKQLENYEFGTGLRDSVTSKIGGLIDVSELQQIFPGIASLTIYPLWDARRDICVAYCIAWSSNPARIIQRQDVIYMASFSNSIIAQLARLETVAADQAKTTFISSISHELRSPLHGILASMEILRDLITDESHRDVISLVESCGSALLDTIDNVLEYSQTSRKSADPAAHVMAASQVDHLGHSASAIDLGKLVEDVTSICLVGLQYSRTPKNSKNLAGSTQPVSQIRSGPIVICNLKSGLGQLFETDRAIWKRILMNILGNAVKYTSSGFIIVEFEHTSLPSTDAAGSMREVKLSVKDSGKGMSQDYLSHHLFKPFHQENPLNPGTGLGLSIVSRLVSSIGGRVNVTSEEGVGTEITVTAKLTAFTLDDVEQPKILNVSPGLTLGFFDFNAAPTLEINPTGILSPTSEAVLTLRSTLSQYATAFDMQAVTAATIESESVDVLVVEDFRFRHLPLTHFKELRKPVIVLCTGLLPNSDQAVLKTSNVVLLPRP